MATISAAQFNLDDVAVVVLLLDSSFDADTPEHKRLRYAALENCAARAGLPGPLTVVWQDAQGRTRFLAPPEQHAFFQIVSYAQLRAQVNCTLECE